MSWFDIAMYLIGGAAITSYIVMRIVEHRAVRRAQDTQTRFEKRCGLLQRSAFAPEEAAKLAGE